MPLQTTDLRSQVGQAKLHSNKKRLEKKVSQNVVKKEHQSSLTILTGEDFFLFLFLLFLVTYIIGGFLSFYLSVF